MLWHISPAICVAVTLLFVCTRENSLYSQWWVLAAQHPVSGLRFFPLQTTLSRFSSWFSRDDSLYFCLSINLNYVRSANKFSIIQRTTWENTQFLTAHSFFWRKTIYQHLYHLCKKVTSPLNLNLLWHILWLYKNF